MFSPLSHNVSGRSGGWFGNSNTPALLLCEMLGFIFALQPRPAITMLVAVCAGVGITITYSRAGYLCWVLMVVWYVANGLRFNFVRTAVLTGVAVTIGVLLLSLMGLN